MLTGFDPGKALVGPGNVSSLSTGWAQATGNSVESSSAVVKGHVYAGSGDGKVYVLEPAAGAVIWDPHRGCVSSSPGVANGVVYVGSSDDNLCALNAAAGLSNARARPAGSSAPPRRSPAGSFMLGRPATASTLTACPDLPPRPRLRSGPARAPASRTDHLAARRPTRMCDTITDAPVGGRCMMGVTAVREGPAHGEACDGRALALAGRGGRPPGVAVLPERRSSPSHPAVELALPFRASLRAAGPEQARPESL